jgi:RHS repeat-associated protein
MRQFTSPTSSMLYFLHSDHLGSTSLTTDASGNPVARQLYDAWGNVRYVTGTLPTDITFTGQRSNLEQIGLYYFKARFYASSIGRFISADTIVPSPADPQSLNRYSYVRNRPLNSIDPSGHVDCDINLWGDTCQSSSAYEREQTDRRNAWCAYDPAACEYNTEGVGAALELLGSVLLEPVDWFLTGRDCLNGDCSGVLLGLLPFVPGSARKVFNVVDDGADLVRPIQRFKKLVAANFRENLRRLTGKASGAIKGLEAHHVLPQEFVDKFKGLGFEIHDPRFGSWVDAPSHRKWSHEYNQRWKEFLNTNPDKEGVLDFARQLSKEYGFDVHFDEP